MQCLGHLDVVKYCKNYSANGHDTDSWFKILGGKVSSLG